VSKFQKSQKKECVKYNYQFAGNAALKNCRSALVRKQKEE